MRLTDIGNDIITLRELLVLVCARAEGCWQVDGILFTSCWDECSGEVIQTEVDPVGNRMMEKTVKRDRTVIRAIACLCTS